jgi:hypothetical protein
MPADDAHRFDLSVGPFDATMLRCTRIEGRERMHRSFVFDVWASLELGDGAHLVRESIGQRAVERRHLIVFGHHELGLLLNPLNNALQQGLIELQANLGLRRLELWPQILHQRGHHTFNHFDDSRSGKHG